MTEPAPKDPSIGGAVPRRPNDSVRGGRALSRSRAIVFAVLGVLLLTLGALGVLRADADVEVPEGDAIATAVEAIDFEPVNTDARLLREGFMLQPVWAVSLSVPLDGGGAADFAQLATVEINARTGEVIRVTEGS